MNGKWLQVSLFLVGLIVGGGVSSFVAAAQYSKLEIRMNSIDRRLSRIEGRLDIHQ